MIFEDVNTMEGRIKEKKGIFYDVKNLLREPALLAIILITFICFGIH
jgi:hypothetical protein